MKGRLANVRNLFARLDSVVIVQSRVPPTLFISALLDSTVDTFPHGLGFYLKDCGFTVVLELPPPRRVVGILRGETALNFLRAARVTEKIAVKWKVTVPVFYAPEAPPRFVTSIVDTEMPVHGEMLKSFEQAERTLLGGVRCG
jgi:hypothetical protein